MSVLDSPRKLSHFRKAGEGAAMWSGACVYGLDGQTPSVSQYDSPDPYADDDKLNYAVRSGVVVSTDLRQADEYTLTRESRVAAHLDSTPAAVFFQGYYQTRWSGLFDGFRPQIMPRPLVQNFNPNQVGSKELHKATTYKPFPPMGSILPHYGEDPKAL